MILFIKKLLRKVNLVIVNAMGLKPPQDIPVELMKRYTLDGQISVVKNYYNDVGLTIFPKLFTQGKIKRFTNIIKNRQDGNYRQTDTWLYQAIEKYPIRDKSCVIMGSISPYYESVCLYYGAKTITTIEYNKVISFHPAIITIRPHEFDQNPESFDIGISISSFEHDGLGRYGDPLNPEGDLQAMQKMKSIIKKGGLLFLSVPIGKDMVVWNAHRVYGKIRLPLLIEGWKIIDTFVMDNEKLEQQDESGKFQPVYVLKNI